MVIGAFVTLWVVCGALSSGMSKAFWWREYACLPRESREDPGVWLMFAVFGPLGTAIIFYLTHHAKHGLMYRYPKELASGKAQARAQGREHA